MKLQPPKIASRFLKWFCRSDLFEFILGDLYELFIQRVDEKGTTYARIAYYWDVFRFFRPSNLKQLQHLNFSTMMIQNYLKVGFRSLRKNWANSLINISGLSLSVGCAITTFLFADFFFNLNSIHTNRENIYQVVSHITENNSDQLYGPSPMVTATRLKEDSPDIEHTVSVQYKRGNVKFGDVVFRELILFTNPSYFEMFDFPTESNQRALESNGIVISSRIAKKYFGYKDPIGQRVEIKFGDHIESFTVSDIIGEVPINTLFNPEIILHIDHYMQLTDSRNNWIDEAKATFVSLKEGVSPKALNSLLTSYQTTQNEANPTNPVESFELISFPELTQQSNAIHDSIVHGNDQAGTIGIAVVGILLIIFACLNYVNIAIVSATTRLKEIGVRKVMGGSRAAIAQQFLIENFMTCGFAMIIGIVSAYYLLLPGFNKFAPVDIPFSFSSLGMGFVYFIGLFVLLGLLSGSYPAFYISKFQTLKIFKGEKSLGGRNYMSKFLLTAQFSLAILTIMGCFIFSDNAQYIKTVSWGYDPAGILSLPIEDPQSLRAMENFAKQQADISMVSTSKGHMGVRNNLVPFEYLDHQFKILQYDVHPGYLELMGLNPIDGSLFKNESNQNTVVVNELFVRNMQWKDPIGKSFQIDGQFKTVVGIVPNVYHVFFDHDVMRPMVFTTQQSEPDFLVVKTSEENIIEVSERLSGYWSEISPFDPYVGYYQSDSFNRAFANVDANTWFMMTLSVFTIFLSCLGLYGLLAFTLQNRSKEFSIRKVLGASYRNLLIHANKEIAWILLIATGIGAPLGIWLIRTYIQGFFAISKPLSWIPISLCLLVVFAAIFITVFAQLRKVTKVNPASVLKGE